MHARCGEADTNRCGGEKVGWEKRGEYGLAHGLADERVENIYPGHQKVGVLYCFRVFILSVYLLEIIISFCALECGADSVHDENFVYQLITVFKSNFYFTVEFKIQPIAVE